MAQYPVWKDTKPGTVMDGRMLFKAMEKVRDVG